MEKKYAYFSLIMGLIFIGFGILIPFRPPAIFEELKIEGNALLIGAVILIMYGTFRITRALKYINKK